MNFKKAVSLVTLSCFLLSFLSGETLQAAVEVYSNTEQVKRVLDGFTVPHTCGRITEVCVSSAAVSASGRKPVVVSIQDLHCNPEVQRNIAKILAELDKKYGLNRVYVEGGYGDVSTAWLCNIQDKALRKEVAEALLDQGKLTGTEYYSVMANRPALLKGLEDRALHQENVIRLGKILEKKDHFEAKLAGLDRDLKYMEGKYLSSKNRDFNALVAKHRRGRIDDDKYFQRLGKYVAAINDDPGKYNAILPISMADYPVISAYGELLRSAKHLRYDRIQRQMQRFVQLLKAKLPYSAYNDLMAKTDNFSRLDDLYIYLAKLAKSDTIISAQTGRRQFPDLYRFFDYVEKNQSINPLAIIEEEKRLTEEIRIGLSRDASELEVSFLEDFYGYFRNYLLNELTADDYNYFEQRFEKFQTIWGKYAVRNRILELKDDFTLLNAYYAVNCERNDRFLDNIGEARLSGAADTPDELLKNSDIIVIVAGGFHSAGLKELITAKNMPYITITPNATHGTTLSDALYTSLAREQAKVFASQSLALALGSTDAEVVSITKTRVKVLLNGVEVTLLRNEQEPDKLTIDPAWQQSVTIAGNVWSRDALELALNDAWKMSLALQGFTNFAMTRELIYELMKMFARLGAQTGIFGSNGLIWAIASDETVKQIISTREKISIEELGRLFEYFQAVIAGHAMQRETRGRIAKGSSFIEAVMAVAEQHLLSLSAEDQRKPGEGLAVDGDIVRFYTSPDSDGKTVYEKWDTAEDVGTRVTPAAYSPGYQREMVSLFETLLKTGEDRMLSVGAGVGRIESMLQKEKGYKNIVVTDVMPEAVALLKEKGLNALLADGRKLPELPLERFEVVYMDGSLGHMASSFETISEDGDNFRVPLMEMNRALADNGTIVISDDIPPEGQAYEINPRVKFLRLNDVTMTRELEGAGFTVREIRDIFYERPGLGKVPRRVIIARKTGYRGAGQGAAEDFLAQLNRDLSGFKPSQREKLFVAALRELDDRREEEFIQLKDTIRNMAIQNAAEAVRETGLAPYSFHRTSMLIWGIHVDGQNPVLEIAKERVRKGFENEIRYRQFEINIDHKIAREYHFGPLRLSQREKLDTPYEFKDGHITYYGVRLQYDAGEVSSTLTAKRYHGYYFPHLMSGQEDETEAYSELRMNPIALKYCPGGCVFCERLKNVLPTKDEADNPYKITPEELVERIVREHPGKLAKVDKAKLITDSLGKEEDALKYLEKLARLLRENGFKGTLHFAGYEIQTPEGLQRLRKAGWSYFNLTVEVFSRRKEIIRGVKYIPLQGAFDILRRAKTIGFDKVVISYIAGLDTLEEFETDIKQLRSEGLIAALASNIMVPFASHHEKLVIPEGKDIGYYVQLNRILRENGLPVYQPEDYEKGLFQVFDENNARPADKYAAIEAVNPYQDPLEAKSSTVSLETGPETAADFLARLDKDLSGFKPSQREKLFVAALRELDDRREEEFIQLKDTIRNMALKNAAEAIRETGLMAHFFHRTNMLIWGIHVDGQNPVLETVKERVHKGFENEIRYKQLEMNLDDRIARTYDLVPMRASQREKKDTPYELKDGRVTYYGVPLKYHISEVRTDQTPKRYNGYYFPHLNPGEENDLAGYEELRMNPYVLECCPGGCVFCDRLKNVMPTEKEIHNYRDRKNRKIDPKTLVDQIVREHPDSLPRVKIAKLITDSLGKEEDAVRYVEELAKNLQEHGFKGILSFTGYEIQSPEALRRVNAAGWTHFNLTLEVFSRRKEILTGTKHTTWEKAQEILNAANKTGFGKVVINYVAGLDTLEDFEQGIEKLEELGLNEIGLNAMGSFASHQDRLFTAEGRDINYYVQVSRILEKHRFVLHNRQDYEKGVFHVFEEKAKGPADMYAVIDAAASDTAPDGAAASSEDGIVAAVKRSLSGAFEPASKLFGTVKEQGTRIATQVIGRIAQRPEIVKTLLDGGYIARKVSHEDLVPTAKLIEILLEQGAIPRKDYIPFDTDITVEIDGGTVTFEFDMLNYIRKIRKDDRVVIADRGKITEQDWQEGLELERSDSLIRDSYIKKLAGRQLTDRQRGELKAQAARLLLKGRREYRGDAARALAIIGTEKDYDTLMEAFNDDGIESSTEIRNEIISSIGRLHIQEAVPDLLKRYRAAKERFKESYAKKAQANDTDRRAALTQKDVIATALGRIGDIAAVSELITDMKNIYMNDDGKGIGIAEDGYESYFYQFRPPFFAILEIYDRNKHDAGKVETIVDQLIGTLLKAGEEPGLDTKWSAEALLKIINIEQQDTKITGALAKFRAAPSAVDDDMEQAVRKLVDARKKSLIAERSAKEAAAPPVTVNRTKKGQELYLDFHYVESQGLLMKAANEFGAEMIDSNGDRHVNIYIVKHKTAEMRQWHWDNTARNITDKNRDNKTLWASTEEAGVVVLTADGAEWQLIASDITNMITVKGNIAPSEEVSKTFNGFFKALHIDIRPNTLKAGMIIDHTATSRKIRTNEDGMMMVPARLFSEVPGKTGQEARAAKAGELMTIKHAESVALPQNIFVYLDKVKNMPELLKILNVFLKVGIGQMIIDQAVFDGVSDEDIQSIADLALNSRKNGKTGVLIVIDLTNAPEQRERFRKLGFPHYMLTVNNEPRIYGFAAKGTQDTGMKAARIRGYRNAGHLRSLFWSTREISKILDLSELQRRLKGGQQDILDRMALSEIFKTTIMSLYSASTLSEEYVRDVAYAWDRGQLPEMKDMDALLKAVTAENRTVNGIVEAMGVKGSSHAVTTYLAKLEEDVRGTANEPALEQLQLAFLTAITKRMLAKHHLAQPGFGKKNGLADHELEIVLGQKLLQQVMEKTAGKGISMTAEDFKKEYNVMAVDAYEKLHQEIMEMNTSTDPRVINAIIELIPQLAEPKLPRNPGKQDLLFSPEAIAAILKAA